MKIAVTYSSKEGLEKEYKKRYGDKREYKDVPVDFFAEGDSLETINAILKAIRANGYNAVGIEGDDEVGRKLEEAKPDLVFNIVEGLFGDFRESYIPMVCERWGLPYTGSDPLTLGICLNKARTKEILHYYKIPIVSFKTFYSSEDIDLRGVEFPAIVKPVSEGSSKGIFNDSVVKDERTARERILEKMLKYEGPVMIEKLLVGDEFTVAVWGNGDDVEVLPIISINYKDLPPGANPIYSYEAKWVWDVPERPLDIFKCPADIPSSLKSLIEKIVKDTYKALKIRDWCRMDLRCDEKGNPYILEVNPLPGILPNPEDNSCFPKAARTAGYSYEKMLKKVIEIACMRLGLKK